MGASGNPLSSGKEFDAINPANGKLLARIAHGDAADVDLAVKAARRAFEGEWSRWTPYDRQKLLLRIHDLVQKHFDELALIETLDMGAPITRTRALKDWISQVILFFASQTAAGGTETPRNSLPGQIMTLTHKAPLGVVGGIIPVERTVDQPMVDCWSDSSLHISWYR